MKFVDDGWETNKISSAIAKFIVLHGYGFEVSDVRIASQVDYEQKMVDGGVDVYMEMWQQNYEDWFAAERRRKVSVRGTLYEGGTQGWYVPTYVIEGGVAPGLKSVQDLAKHAAALGGKFYSCPTTFNCDKINKVKLKVYGLSEAFTVVNPASHEELTDTLMKAYEAKEPIIGYFREPTWLTESQKWTRLEEPAWSALCWARIRNVLVGTRESAEEACAYPQADVEKGIYRGLVGRSEAMATFFFNMNLGRDGLLAAVKYFHDNKATADQTAINYLKTQTTVWKSWIPDAAVVEMVSKALATR